MQEPTEQPSAVGERRRRACTNCTTSKAKCTAFSRNECERCHRLGKECRYNSVAATRKRPQPNSRLRALELEVERLAARQEAQPQVGHQSVPIRHFNDSVGSSGASQWPAWTSTPSSSGPAGFTPSPNSATVSSNGNGGTGDVIDRGMVTRELAECLLDRFRTNAAQQFPFVVVPSAARLDDIRQNTPFLFLAIVATMSFDNFLLQQRLGDELCQQTLEATLSGAKSLQLLQGLLIYIAWYCHFYRVDKHYELLLSQLSVTIAHDLGLDKRKNRQAEPLDHCNSATDTEPSASLIMAQMRAYLGTYCVSCLVSSIQRRRTALPHTRYMEFCCQKLAEVKEYETDELIPHLVRSQKLSRQVTDTFSYDDVSSSDIQGEFLVGLTTDGFIQYFDRLQLEIPPSLKKNALLELEFHTSRIMINEVALHAEYWTSADGDEQRATDSRYMPIARTKMLWRSLNSCKEFIHGFLSYQSQDLFYLTVFIYPRLCYVFINLAKLVALDSDNRVPTGPDVQSSPWGMADVAKEADFQNLANKVLAKLTAVATNARGPHGQRDGMSNLASAMRILIAGHGQKMGEMPQSSNGVALPVSAAIPKEHNNEMADSSAYSSVQETGDGAIGDFGDISAWEPSIGAVWDDILETFTLDPFLQ